MKETRVGSAFMVRCPNGHEVADDATFCPVCGTKISEKRRCPKGHEVVGDATFCPVCGARVTRQWLRWPQTLRAKIGAAIGTAAALVGLVLGARQIDEWLFPPPKVSAVFVLDTSAAMTAPFGETTKLRAAKKEIQDLVATYPNMAASLRLSGGSCTDQTPGPVVTFHKHAHGDFVSQLGNLHATEKSDYVRTLESAVNDFLDGDAADSETKLIYVFIGSTQEECSGLPNAVIGAEGIKVELFALGVPPDSLKATKRELEDLGIGIRANNVGSKRALGKAVGQAAGDQISPNTKPQTPHQAGIPRAPTALSGTTGNGEVTLTWRGPASDGGSPITGYRVTYLTGSARTPIEIGSTQTHYTVTGLQNGSTYSFTVAAINDVGTGPESSDTGPLTPQAGKPEAPTALSGTAGNGEVTLTWQAPASDGGSSITGYRITPYAAGSAQSPIEIGPTPTQYTVTGLQNGIKYTFAVVAISDAGAGLESTYDLIPTESTTTDKTTIPSGPAKP